MSQRQNLEQEPSIPPSSGNKLCVFEFVAFCKQAGLPMATVQYWIENFEKAHPTIVTAAIAKEETRVFEEENARLTYFLIHYALSLSFPLFFPCPYPEIGASNLFLCVVYSFAQDMSTLGDMSN